MSASDAAAAAELAAPAADSAPAELPAGFPAPAARVVAPFAPSAELRLSFDGIAVTQGSEVTPTQGQHLPAVELSLAAGSAEDKLYTLILSDPDAPSVADPKFGEVSSCAGAQSLSLSLL